MSTDSSASSASTGSGGSPSAFDSGNDAAGAVFLSPYATVSVKTHVPMVLEMKHSNYDKWSSFFRSLCGKFGLLQHIDGTPAPQPADSAWQMADYCVCSWIYGSVSDGVLDLARGATE
jgi:hypothetical protein